MPCEGIAEEALGETQGMATDFGRPVGDFVGSIGRASDFP